jgi:DinB superfamily
MTNAEIRVPLSRVLQDLDAAETQATEVIDGLSSRQANWQPQDSWSIVQCLNHLARMNCVYSAAIHEAVVSAPTTEAADPGMIVPGWFGTWFIRSTEPPVRTRMKAPRKILPEVQTSDPREALAEFVASHSPVRAVAEAVSDIDVNKVRFKNPFTGLLRFTVGTGLLVVNAHDRRHLWQANQVKKAPGYPGGHA